MTRKIMQKGLTNIDLLLALLAMLTAFTAINIQLESLSKQAQEIEIRNSLKHVLLDVYTSVGTAKAYSLEETGYTTPALRLAESTIPLPCKIQLDQQQKTMKVIYNKGQADESKVEYTGINMDGVEFIGVDDIKDFECGKTITIRKA